MKELVPVVFATDDIFAPYCAVSIRSLLDNRNREREYALYILYDELSEENLRLLNGMAEDKATIECIQITKHIDRNVLYTHERLTIATYFRFFVAEELPQYDKLLYLDSDIVILGDVGDLYDQEIGNNLLGGVVIYRGMENEAEAKVAYLREQIGVTPENYINAGVLIINLKAFREEKVKEKCLKYIAENRELKWLDQDALNAVCKGRIKFLNEAWNCSQFYYDDDFRAGRDMSGVKLIHYITQNKPWLVNYRLSHLFFYQNAFLTPYRERLQAEMLQANAKLRIDVRKSALEMAKRTEIGPRFFFKCLCAWAKAKLTGKKSQ